ncbi:GNAT family N-acetyltransferase [Nonlabens ulvanivorans]|uniref:GNAT family N-acetyltransferase n=1 Tax=Nonlabens ulvanivorans TaxID=906888 RepID=UPI00294239BE|nr:GNAT family N-acetyltransferase [Nonlabens ulvanivorans]WOI22258.1 GNAT family N-acetyltransferase [Nonlabens ulvanivorans]
MKYIPLNLETDRLRFRLITKSDFETWLPFFSPDLNRHFLFLDADKTALELCAFWFEKCLLRYEENRGGLNALIDKTTGKMIGQCGILVQHIDGEPRLEVGYSILPGHRNKGYATEAAVAAKNYAFEHKMDLDFNHTVVSMLHIDNHGSEKVAIANGMTLEKTFTDFGDNRFHVYSQSRKEWLKTK